MQTNAKIFKKVDEKCKERYGVSFIDKKGKIKSVMFPLGTTYEQAIIKLVNMVD